MNFGKDKKERRIFPFWQKKTIQFDSAIVQKDINNRIKVRLNYDFCFLKHTTLYTTNFGMAMNAFEQIEKNGTIDEMEQ